MYFIADRTNLYMRLQTLNFLFVIVAFVLGASVFHEPIEMVGLLAIAYSINYFPLFGLMLNMTRKRFDRPPSSGESKSAS